MTHPPREASELTCGGTAEVYIGTSRIASSSAGNDEGPPQFMPGHGESDVSAVGRGACKPIDYSKFANLKDSDDEDADHLADSDLSGYSGDGDESCNLCNRAVAEKHKDGIPICTSCCKTLEDRGF